MRVLSMRRGTTIFDVMIALSTGVFAAALLLPGVAQQSINQSQQQNMQHQQRILMAMVTFASANNERYPGLDSRGRVLDGDAEAWMVDGKAASGGHPGTRYMQLLQGAYFTGEMILSPADRSRIWVENAAGEVDDITTENYSYAMLRIQQGDGAGDPMRPGQLKTYGRVFNEWRDTLNSEAVVISDRNTGDGCGEGVQSLYTREAGRWRGSVVYNDGHVEFENTHVLRTKYARSVLMVNGQGEGVDNLFSDADSPERESGNNPGNSGVSAEGPAGTQAQAAMVYQDTWTYVNQR